MGWIVLFYYNYYVFYKKEMFLDWSFSDVMLGFLVINVVLGVSYGR